MLFLARFQTFYLDTVMVPHQLENTITSNTLVKEQLNPS